jgi:hypothetical protein
VFLSGADFAKDSPQTMLWLDLSIPRLVALEPTNWEDNSSQNIHDYQ